MMKLLLLYSARNLVVRKITTLLTAGGMALVVFVFASVLMLDAGLRKTLSGTGDDLNAIVLRRAAEVEMQSIVDRRQASIIAGESGILLDDDGLPLLSKEVVVMIGLTDRGPQQTRSIIVRGVGSKALAVRPQISIMSGRMFHPGSNEIVIGGRLKGIDVGSSIRFAQRDWRVVGRFDGRGSGFDSEIWGDADQIMQAFRRNAFSAVVLRLSSRSAFGDLKEHVESDPRLTVEVKPERTFYEEQSRMLSGLIQVLGVSLSLLFSVAAIIGAAITMYSTVASRKREIGALRALGFRRSVILQTFLAESLLISLVGWIAGLALASFMVNVQITTLNWTSFAELAIGFVLTPGIMLQTLMFAFAMGLLGGLLPAWRAASMRIVDALRAG